MKKICNALAAGMAILAGILATPASAVPPTVTPSPGYEARLQESRARAATATHAPGSRMPKLKFKKKSQR